MFAGLMSPCQIRVAASEAHGARWDRGVGVSVGAEVRVGVGVAVSAYAGVGVRVDVGCWEGLR